MKDPGAGTNEDRARFDEPEAVPIDQEAEQQELEARPVAAGALLAIVPRALN